MNDITQLAPSPTSAPALAHAGGVLDDGTRAATSPVPGGAPTPAGDGLPYDDPTFLAELYRRELADDLGLVATFLRHPVAARRGAGPEHSVAVPGLPGVTASFRARRAPVPPALVRQLALRHPEYRRAEGRRVYASEVTVRLSAPPGMEPQEAAAATVARALAEAMHPRGCAADVHDAGADGRGARRFRWMHDPAGTVLPTPAELFAGRAA
ncbi:hypothetical protein [Corynebacterium sp. 335C]